MSFQVALCRDIEFIDHLFDELRFEITMDGWPSAPPAEAMLQVPSIFFISVREDDKAPEGAFMFTGDEAHTLFLPSLRGGRAIRAGRAALDWVWKNTDKTCIRSYFYSHRPDVRLFAKLLGFTEKESVDDGSKIGGKPVMRTNLFISRP